MNLKLFATLTLLLSNAFAYIPKGYYILQNTVNNHGTPPYVIEKEVQFSSAQGPIYLKEVWQIENENSMKVTVTGLKELKDTLRIQYLYQGESRSQLENGKRIVTKLSPDFFEKFFHFKSAETYANNLIQMTIAPSSIFAKKTAKKAKEFDNKSEPFIRLSRVGGTVSYAFGTPTPAESNQALPGLWIEQDLFFLRKLRLPSGAEVLAEKQSPGPKGIQYPMKTSVAWGNSTVQIQTLGIQSKPKLNLGQLDGSHYEGLEALSIKNEILEFYTRFR